MSVMIRALRVEMVKPLSEAWEDTGPTLRTLSKVTPILLNAALDALIAADLVGSAALKKAIAPGARANSPEGLAYQAVRKKEEDLREWARKLRQRTNGRQSSPFELLDVPGLMSSQISRTAKQAFARRDQEPPRFSTPRILVHGDNATIAMDDRGATLELKLRSKGTVRFALAPSSGKHRDTLRAIASGELAHGDVKIQHDDERRKWYALISYKQDAPKAFPVDERRVLVVHRGVRNALYLLGTDGKSTAIRGGKFLAQRRKLQRRCRDIRMISQSELGSGAKGHGRSRRLERYSALEDKIARLTHTWCQQTAAFVAQYAVQHGYGAVVIEDYGGIQPNEKRALRVALERFPLYELKLAIKTRLECVSDGTSREFREASSEHISSMCPVCDSKDQSYHNVRTNIFHCRTCTFERDADWIAAYWLLTRSGADMTKYMKEQKRVLSLVAMSRTSAAAE
jgi:transposase